MKGPDVAVWLLIVCVTINSIHRRNKKAEVLKEAIKNGLENINISGL